MNNIELHYGKGGHGGPYATADEATGRAIKLLEGSRTERSITVRRGVNGPLLRTVRKELDRDGNKTITITHETANEWEAGI